MTNLLEVESGLVNEETYPASCSGWELEIRRNFASRTPHTFGQSHATTAYIDAIIGVQRSTTILSADLLYADQAGSSTRFFR